MSAPGDAVPDDPDAGRIEKPRQKRERGSVFQGRIRLTREEYPEVCDYLRSLPLYHGLGCPILLGVSRKELGSQTERGLPPKERLPVSLAAAMHALDRGIQILRVHDVAETRRVIGLWQRLNDS